MSVQHGNGGYRRTPARVLAWRFVAGHEMSGRRSTNRTFTRRATRDLTDHGHASRWQHRAGWERATIRAVTTAVTLAILYGYLTDRAVTADACLGALAGLGIGLAIRGRYAVARARHDRRTVRPLYQAMTQIVNVGTVPAHIQAYGENHKRHLRVPLNYRDPKARIRFEVPQSWIGDQSQVRQLNNLIARRLGGDWDAIPHWGTYPPHIEFLPSPAPPRSVSFADILPAIERGKDSEIIIGIGTHNRMIGIDLSSDSPHILASIASGGGKSALLRLMVIQLIRKGCERIDVCDIKRVSHSWAKGLDGVFIHRSMNEMQDAVSAFRKRMEERYQALEVDENVTFKRQVLLIEEMNSMMQYAKQHHEDYRNELDKEERAKTPKRAPIIGDMAYILNQGRQAESNVIAVAQRASAAASGGGDMRINFGARILARWDTQTWAMVVGTRPVPRSSRINGRGRFVLGDEDCEVQFGFVTEDEAKTYALRYAKTVREDFNPLIEVPADNAGSDDSGPMMSLRELVESGIVSVRYSSATRARTRAGDSFPKGKRTPIGTVYEPGKVREFFESRSRKVN